MDEHTRRSNGTTESTRIRGLDLLRGLCAVSVVLGHVGLPPMEGGTFLKMWRFAFQIISNGPAAVVVFFIISGLCIHLPQARGRSLRLGDFYAKRMTRIGIPMAAASLLAYISGAWAGLQGVLWSLVCELIYYTVYPLLLIGARRYGWWKILASSGVALMALLISDPKGVEYGHFGWGLTWILGLPIWILGCILAESLRHHAPAPGLHKVWALRVALGAASALSIVARWKLGEWSIGFPWTLTLFGVVAWLWLGIELRNFQRNPVPRWMDRIGSSSYSIYLTHTIVIHGAWVLFGGMLASGLGIRGLLALVALAIGWLFFTAVERPSHRIVSRIGSRPAQI